MIINLRLSRGSRLILNRNTKGCEVAEHIPKKVEINPQILSTLKNEESIWSMNPEEISRHQWLDLWKF